MTLDFLLLFHKIPPVTENINRLLISGLYRYYDPTHGRFLSRDPIGYIDDVNPYRYVGNNPMMYSDPSGMFLETVWDMANVTYDGGRLIKNTAELGYGGIKYLYASYTNDSCSKKQALASMRSDVGDLGEASIDIGTDALATLIPFVPAGTTKLARVGGKAVKASVEAVEQGGKKIGKQAIKEVTEKTVQNAPKGTANPVVKEAAAKGRQMHKDYQYGEGFVKEVRIDGYGRADAVNFDTKTVLELKPNNPVAIAKGEKQLQRYIEGLKNMETSQGLKPSNWNGSVITY